MTRVWFISDTHCAHGQLEIPTDVDAVIHCGDESNSRRTLLNAQESRRFFDWYSQLPIPVKVFVPGNHSMAIEKGEVLPTEFPQVKFLIHEEFEVAGFRVFGSPYTPWFFGWAYNVARPDLDAYWSQIPAEIDVLITHGPPKGIFDVTLDWRTQEPIHIGSKSLRQHVKQRIKPRVHAFGHLHDEADICNFGQKTIESIQFINCSCVNQQQELIHHGYVLEL